MLKDRDAGNRFQLKTTMRHVAVPWWIGQYDKNRPTENRQSYIHRGIFYSLQLQAVCSSDLIFLICFCGYAESCLDVRVLFCGSLP